MFQEKFEDPNG